MTLDQKKEYAKKWEYQLGAFKPLLLDCFKEYYIGSDYRNRLNDEEVKHKIQRIEEVINSITYVFVSSNAGKIDYVYSTDDERLRNDEIFHERLGLLTDDSEAFVFPRTYPPIISFDINRPFDIERVIHELNHTLHNKELPPIKEDFLMPLPKRYQEGISNGYMSRYNWFYEIINQCMTKDIAVILKDKLPNYPVDEESIPPIYEQIDYSLYNIISNYYDEKIDFLKDTLLNAEGNIIANEIEENTGYTYSELNKSLGEVSEKFESFVFNKLSKLKGYCKNMAEYIEKCKELFVQEYSAEIIENDEILLAFEEYVNKLKNNKGAY